MRELLEEIERRRAAKDDPCDSCNGTGGPFDGVCTDCLGQGILLTREEYLELLRITGHIPDDSVLDAEYLD